MIHVVWNDLGKEMFSNNPRFRDYSSGWLHEVLSYLCGTLYCYVLDNVIYHWDDVYGVPDTVGTLERE